MADIPALVPATPTPVSASNKRGRPKNPKNLAIVTGSAAPATPATGGNAATPATGANATPESKPTVVKKRKSKTNTGYVTIRPNAILPEDRAETIQRLTAQLAAMQAEKDTMRAQTDVLLAETNAVKAQLAGLQRENTFLREDVTSLQREKAALQRAVGELASDAAEADGRARARSVRMAVGSASGTSGRMDDIFEEFLLHGQDAAPEAQSQSQSQGTGPSTFLWAPHRDVNDILRAIFSHAPAPTHFPPKELYASLCVEQQHQVAVMCGLGHSVAGLHAGVPIFQPGPFLQCPTNPGPIFAMYQWQLRFFHGGCVGCRATNTECQLSGQEYYYLRLKYNGTTAVAWIPDSWVTRVLRHAVIP